ncbi:hypothetical protein QJS04_geneDACA004834 [Acorus gramineus]|uniref:Uncharacterized protein n=1 Tax=Acorus gramineus TaxID=55184 RepID=A0AAV9BUP0_ACOGR|nr:hypothetical protein QJS04_geneDACA004834 [Acorus gramineus]
MDVLEADEEEFSASSTVVMFDRPVPLLRGPIRAGPSDDPSMGTFVLAFRDPESWRSAFLATESKIVEQCEAGARMGCSISASKKCKPPWWKMLFGTNPGDIDERKRCEEREMSSCLEASKESCKKFAHEKCLPPFRDARIASVKQEGLLKSLYTNSMTGEDNLSATTSLSTLSKSDALVTNFRGSVLLIKSSDQH